MLLQIMEDGHLTDAKGRRVDFRNTIIIMTSNVGAELLKRDTTLGYAVKQDEAKNAKAQYEKMKEKVLSEMKNLFRPEFLNRIDATVVFHALNVDEIRQIVDLMLKRVRIQLSEQQIKLELTDAAKDLLVKEGYDQKFGARPLRRAIQNLIEDPLAEGLLEGRFPQGSTVVVDVEDGKLEMKAREALEEVAAGAGSS